MKDPEKGNLRLRRAISDLTPDKLILQEAALHHAIELAARIAKGDAPEVPVLAVRVITGSAGQIGDLPMRLAALEKELLAWHRSN